MLALLILWSLTLRLGLSALLSTVVSSRISSGESAKSSLRNGDEQRETYLGNDGTVLKGDFSGLNALLGLSDVELDLFIVLKDGVTRSNILGVNGSQMNENVLVVLTADETVTLSIEMVMSSIP